MPNRKPSRRSHCPHCGKDTPTVRGTCTECWGSKGGRLFTVEKRGPEGGPYDPAPWQWGSWGCSSTMVVIVGVSLLMLTQWN